MRSCLLHPVSHDSVALGKGAGSVTRGRPGWGGGYWWGLCHTGREAMCCRTPLLGGGQQTWGSRPLNKSWQLKSHPTHSWGPCSIQWGDQGPPLACAVPAVPSTRRPRRRPVPWASSTCCTGPMKDWALGHPLVFQLPVHKWPQVTEPVTGRDSWLRVPL